MLPWNVARHHLVYYVSATVLPVLVSTNTYMSDKRWHDQQKLSTNLFFRFVGSYNITSNIIFKTVTIQMSPWCSRPSGACAQQHLTFTRRTAAAQAEKIVVQQQQTQSEFTIKRWTHCLLWLSSPRSRLTRIYTEASPSFCVNITSEMASMPSTCNCTPHARTQKSVCSDLWSFHCSPTSCLVIERSSQLHSWTTRETFFLPSWGFWEMKRQKV